MPSFDELPQAVKVQAHATSHGPTRGWHEHDMVMVSGEHIFTPHFHDGSDDDPHGISRRSGPNYTVIAKLLRNSLDVAIEDEAVEMANFLRELLADT